VLRAGAVQVQGKDGNAVQVGVVVEIVGQDKPFNGEVTTAQMTPTVMMTPMRH